MSSDPGRTVAAAVPLAPELAEVPHETAAPAMPAVPLPPAAPPAAPQPPARSLARRFFWQVATLSVGLVLLSGAVEGWFSYRETRAQIASMQALQAQAAGTEIEQYLSSLRRGLDAVQALPWGQAGFGAPERRQELQRLLPLNPAIVELVDLDAAGRLLIRVSRTEPDLTVPASEAAARPAPPGGAPALGFAAPQFDAGGEPIVRLVVERKGEPSGRTAVALNLRFLADVVSGLRVAESGEVYVVDAANQLIAHPDAAQVLRQHRLGVAGDAVALARAALALGQARMEAAAVQGLGGQPAVATAVALKETGWLLFVEQPRALALQPVFATLQRTLALLALAALLAMLTSAAFARRMAAPIATLREATAAIAQGRRGERISLHSRDELQALAGDFNTMLDKLERSYAELEAKVVARTAEAVQGREEAERANAAKSRFLASASHDLRQPMHAIGLWVSLLRESLGQARPEQLHELTAKVYQAVRSMDALFSGLLDISKLDAGAVKPLLRAFALTEVLERVVALSAPLAQAKGIELRVRCSRRGEPVVNSDPLLVERIVANLVSNAIRYTPRGGVLISARRHGGEIWLRVTDTGVGIPPDQIELVFEEFVRLARARVGPGSAPGAGPGLEEGLGLGLAIVRRTAQLLGARVWANSLPGRGSAFTLALRASAEPLPHATEPALASSGIAGAFVIVIDNDVRNLEACAELLRAWGCTVAVAGGAEAALAECGRHLRAPDVIVCDLRLGEDEGLDGIELIRRLRAQAGAWVPALLVTAEARLPRQPDGDVAVLQKPVPDTVLRAALAKAMVGQTAGQPTS